jgi:hypothetical protein
MRTENCAGARRLSSAHGYFSGAGQLLTKIRGKTLAQAAGFAPCIA